MQSKMSEKKETLKSAMVRRRGKVSSMYSIVLVFFMFYFLEAMSNLLYTNPNKDNTRGKIAIATVTWMVFRMALVSSYQVYWG